MNSTWISEPVSKWLPLQKYRGYLPGLPDLYVGRLPEYIVGPRVYPWKIWFIETPEEADALEKSLDKPILMRRRFLDFKSGPDATCSRPNLQKDYGPFTIALYAPDEADTGWPWITVTRFPTVKMAGDMAHELGRGVYGYDIDMDEITAIKRVEEMQRAAAAAGALISICTP